MLRRERLAPDQLDDLRRALRAPELLPIAPPSSLTAFQRVRRSYGVTLTARTIQSSPTSRIVDRRPARLLQVAEERAPAGERAGDDRAVRRRRGGRRARCPSRSAASSRSIAGSDAVEERADRLAAEKRGVLGNDVAKGVGEGVLELVLGDVGEAAGLELAEVGPGLRLEVGRDDARGLHRSRQAARDHAVELDPAEHRRSGVRLVAPGDGERHVLGLQRPSVGRSTRPRRAA